MSMKEVVEAEYARCLRLAANPAEAPALFGVEGRADVSQYYAFRAEALGWVLDRMDRDARADMAA
jgi:hypothetical protein